MLLTLAGLCALVDISPHIACMVFGATYINYTKDNKLYSELTAFTPPIMSIFFVLGGMNLSIGSLGAVGVIGIVYTLVRIIGKYVGTFVGASVAKAPPVYKKYLGLSLVPQAGVAIGLAFLAQMILPAGLGDTILTIILASSVIYEIIGPACAKASLVFAGAIPKESKTKKAPSLKANNSPVVEADDILGEALVNQPCENILSRSQNSNNTSSGKQSDLLNDVYDNIEE